MGRQRRRPGWGSRNTPQAGWTLRCHSRLCMLFRWRTGGRSHRRSASGGPRSWHPSGLGWALEWSIWFQQPRARRAASRSGAGKADWSSAAGESMDWTNNQHAQTCQWCQLSSTGNATGRPGQPVHCSYSEGDEHAAARWGMDRPYSRHAAKPAYTGCAAWAGDWQPSCGGVITGRSPVVSRQAVAAAAKELTASTGMSEDAALDRAVSAVLQAGSYAGTGLADLSAPSGNRRFGPAGVLCCVYKTLAWNLLRMVMPSF